MNLIGSVFKRITGVVLAGAMTLTLAAGAFPSTAVAAENVLSRGQVGAVVVDSGMVAICLGATNIKDANLTVRGENGTEYVLKSMGEDKNTVAFATDALPKGEYTFVSLSFRDMLGTKTTSLKGDAAIDFGVGTHVDNEPDAYIVEDDYVEPSVSVEPRIMSDVKGLSGQDVVVVLDPGHDDKHIGAKGTYADGTVQWEQYFTLKIAQACFNKLSTYPGVKVYMTRNTGACAYNASSSATCLTSRVNFAKSVGCDLFVSFHLNAANGVARGVEVYYPNGNYVPLIGSTGQTVAQSVLNSLLNLGLVNRGVKIRNSSSTYSDGSVADYLSVIKNSKLNGFTGTLIEHCFMDTRAEFDQYLSSDAALTQLGTADAEGIAASLNLVRGNVPSINSYMAELKRREEELAQQQQQQQQQPQTQPQQPAQPAQPTQPQVNPNAVQATTLFDADYYWSQYPDLQKVFDRSNQKALQEHFNLHGRKEGRRGSEAFDVRSYAMRYPDLRKAFGLRWDLLYKHYEEFGAKEGRSGAYTTQMVGATSTYGGVNYSEVYDYNYYINKYPDLKAVFSGDDAGAIKHFVNNGMKERRLASDKFDVRYYIDKYADLRKAFGENYPEYYKHYMQYGINESKRYGTKDQEPKTQTQTNTGTSQYPLYEIMGKTNPACNVYSMSAYFKTKADYPEFYADNDTDAPTLEDFCRIYLEECAAEGVKAEVAFTQAMLETSFLRYTGTVAIDKFNFAGMGATAEEPDGHQFESVREGIRSHVQHLKAYASTDPLKNKVVDPRFAYVKRGVAPYVEYLGIQENPEGVGWASGVNYGYNIMTWIRSWLEV